MELGADADDLQQGLSLFPGTGLHELRKIQRQLAHELIQQLLAALPAAGVRDLQITIFALALDNQAVGEGELDLGRDGTPLPGSVAGTEPLAAESPADGVQDRGLPLAVVAADDGQTVRGGLQGHRLDAFDVLDLETVDFDWHIHNLLNYLMLSF